MEIRGFWDKMAHYGIDRQFIVDRSKKKLLLKCDQWPFPFKVGEKPHVRTRLRLYCENCKRHHHLWWGEVRNSLKKDPKSIQEVISFHKDKYCKENRPISNNELEQRLSLLRAKKLVHPETVIPQHLLDMVKHQKANKVKQLWDEIERLGGEVRELIYERKGIFSFKIITPITGYLSSGTKDEIINLVKNDCEIAYNAKCPFCDCRISLDRDNFGLGTCPHCLAVFGSIAKNFADESLKLLESVTGGDGVYTLLLNWDEKFHYNYDTGMVWIDMQWILKNLKNFDAPDAPDASVKDIQEIEIPLFEDEEAFEDGENIRPAKCSECIHRLETHYRGWGAGAYSFCIYPNHHDQYQDKIGFELEAKIERLRDHSEYPEGVVWNIFLSRFIKSQFIHLGDEDLRGYFVDESKFVENICPNFKLDRDGFYLKGNGGYLILKGHTKIRFGEFLKRIQ